MKVSGRQLTVMVVAVCTAAVLTPTAVYAVTGSSVNITDPVTASQKARIIGSRLVVGDGSGALTVDGTVKATDGSGPLTVDGTVGAADPSTTWSAIGDGIDNGSTPVVLKKAAANVGVSLGTLLLAHTAGTGAVTVHLRTLVPSTPGNCSAGSVQDELMDVPLAQGEVRTITFEPGFRITRVALETCLLAIVSGSSGTHTVNISGTGTTF